MSLSFSGLLSVALPALSRFESGETLDNAIAASLRDRKELRPALQAVMYDLTRHYFLCDFLIRELAPREPADPIRQTLMLGLSEILITPEKSYALVNETVNFVKSQKDLHSASGFVNACLRRFCREKDALLSLAQGDLLARLNAPSWYIKKLEASIGKEETEKLLLLAQEPPRLVLRVNRRKSTPENWRKVLQEKGIASQRIGLDGLLIEKPLPVNEIPGFSEGVLSVQDAGAQLAAQFLNPKDGETILDACAAPGGKTCHLLELSEARVTALEINEDRTALIKENLSRLGLIADVSTADATDAAYWTKDTRFDAILLDAPCTASGILRRHPDIAFLRCPEDIESLAKQQKRLLETLWPLVKFGGRLLYVVCSVFREEGKSQIAEFLKRHKDAHEAPLGSGLASSITLLPADSMQERADGLPRITDGFFYALLVKG